MDVHWLAFNELSSCRVDGGPIPWTAVREWCRTWDYGELEAERLRNVIRRLDVIWMQHQETRRQQRMAASKAKARHNAPRGRRR